MRILSKFPYFKYKRGINGPQGSMNYQIGPYFWIEIQGSMDHFSVHIFKLRFKDPWTIFRSLFLNWDSRIHGPPNRSLFLNWDSGNHGQFFGPNFEIEIQGSMDHLSVHIFKLRFRDPWTIFQSLFFNWDSGIHGPRNRSLFFNWDLGMHGPPFGPNF